MTWILKSRYMLCGLFICVIFIYTVLQDSVLSQLKLYTTKTINNSRNLKKILGCSDTYHRESYLGQRGKYLILHNYFTAARHFGCDQSITYTTHTDFTYLDNLVPLLQRWQGPISIAIFAPGTDFKSSVERILYLRECINTTLVKDLATFHFILDQDHFPKEMNIMNMRTLSTNCTDLQNTISKLEKSSKTYKKANNLLYPINLARNVAREMTTTHFVFASDIELYPSPGLIPSFLEMIGRNGQPAFVTKQPKVFVLSVFEVAANVSRLPDYKSELIGMLKNGSAIPFHKYICPSCHQIPQFEEWLSVNVTDAKPGLNVFHVGKRYKPYQNWEPFYIGTRAEPIYDERLSWEGKSDKMTQGYVLCVMDYEFLILDNAFLVHAPGFKKTPRYEPSVVISKQSALIRGKILNELKTIYGTRPGCTM